MIDLHVHTTFSDGTFTPQEVVRFAKEKGLFAIAITDHDTTDGVKDAIEEGERLGLKVVSGVEISADFEIEMHILGLFIDIDNKFLQQKLKMLEKFRKERNPQIIKKLRQMGYNISMEEVEKLALGEMIGRPHIAKVLVQKGYFSTTKEVFEKLLGFGKPAYVKKEKLKPQEAIEAIKKAGGLAILAHPHKYLYLEEGSENVFLELKEYGLDGIEVFHSDHNQIETSMLLEIAKKLDLAISGGSDFHGENKPEICIGVGKGNLKIDDEIFYMLESRVLKR
ncbi:PHP domain protein [Caldicellulosiruptor obsidiansis OB47]|uniref:PHP domain protein n=1 Tax=Caldicellulosiruptor obsidiansis (strain ATCC BAA-2073 / JCM 16842 / OB47) TaxID=608506 RepID=D9TFN9_CALOO|nr:PHP domain-containing protein [Caldicellulosiruptor obsidiansis]ADL43009.1 PHP domain protein [Caldicellulosiruptor obsidiansis OB47]